MKNTNTGMAESMDVCGSNVCYNWDDVSSRCIGNQWNFS